MLAKDLYGNAVAGALNVGPGEIEASLRGPEMIELTPVKREAGSLTLAYTTIKAGSYAYDLSITHAGRHISGSPWKVRASPGPAVAAMCSVDGLPSSVVSGQSFHFMLQTLDECKNSTVLTNSVTCEVDSPVDGIVPLDVKEVGQGAGAQCLFVHVCMGVTYNSHEWLTFHRSATHTLLEPLAERCTVSLCAA